MKILLLFLILCTLTISYVQSHCKPYNGAYSCGGKGTPHWYRKNGRCYYTCLVNGHKTSCEKIHRPNDMSPYANVPCKNRIFNCGGRGRPRLINNSYLCSFSCVVGDMMLLCQQIHHYV